MEATQTPSKEHERFDQLCSELEEFDHLPSVVSPVLEREPAEEGGDPKLDQLILAGLVSPM